MAMNIFRITADSCHVASILIFLMIVKYKGNGAGISLRAHELYFLVFATRYLDLFTTFYSMLNSCIKILYLGSTMTVIYTLRHVEPAKSTYSASQDIFPQWKCASIAFVIAFLVHIFGSGTVDITGDEFEVHFERYDWFETLWTFSICLEPFAMLPQLYMFWNNRMIQPEVRTAIFLKGIYRLFYIFNWIFRSLKEPHYRHHVLVYAMGGLQVFFYSDFFLYHIRRLCGNFVRNLTSSQPALEQAVESLPLSVEEDVELDPASEIQLRAMDAEQDVKEIDGMQLV